MLTKTIKEIQTMDNTQLEEFKAKYSLSAPLLSKNNALQVEIAIKNREKQLKNTFNFLAENGELKAGEI